MATSWEKLTGHKGIEFRQYGKERSYRFRQHPYGADALGVMPEAQAIRIAAELRENRSTGAGPQSYKEMQGTQAEKAQEAAIAEKKERKRILAEERHAQANTVGAFWDNVYWPQRSKRGSNESNKTINYTFQKWVKPNIGDIPLEELTFTDISNMLNIARDYGQSPRSIEYIYTILQGSWNFAQVYLSTHHQINLPLYPGKMLSLDKLNNEKTCYLEQAEASLLLRTLYNWRECCEKHGIVSKSKNTKDAYGMTVLSLLSGLRLGDICNLTWREVETAFAYARNPKGGKAYGIHLDIPLIREMLEERRAMFPHAKPTDLVFLNSKGQKYATAPRYYSHVIDELGFNFTPRRINNPMEFIDFHALRHTFASWHAQRGINLHTLMILMGHKNITMTLRYARLNPAYTRVPVMEMAQDFMREHALLSDGQYIYVENPQAKAIDAAPLALTK